MSLKRSVNTEAAQDIVSEESVAYDSKSNGEVEKAVQTIQGQTRAVKESLEGRLETRIEGSHHCVPWLVRHSASLLNKFQVGSDGFTAHERWKGKKFRRTLAEFGERVMYLKAGSRGVNKWESIWSDGIFLGSRDECGEIIVGTDEGCVKARDFNIYSDEKERWQIGKFNSFKGVPWEPVPGDPSTEIRVKVNMPSTDGPPIRHDSGREKVAYRFRIQRNDLQKHGLTSGCPGCRAVNRGEPAHNHSEQCRFILEGVKEGK